MVIFSEHQKRQITVNLWHLKSICDRYYSNELHEKCVMTLVWMANLDLGKHKWPLENRGLRGSNERAHVGWPCSTPSPFWNFHFLWKLDMTHRTIKQGTLELRQQILFESRKKNRKQTLSRVKNSPVNVDAWRETLPAAVTGWNSEQRNVFPSMYWYLQYIIILYEYMMFFQKSCRNNINNTTTTTTTTKKQQ